MHILGVVLGILATGKDSILTQIRVPALRSEEIMGTFGLDIGVPSCGLNSYLYYFGGSLL